MISINRRELEDIYKTADEELIDAYITVESEGVYGWRNGLKKGNDVRPGATATALIMNYFAFRREAGIERDISKILKYLLKIQLEDEDGKKTGWEVMSLKSPNGESVPSVDVTAIVLDTLHRNFHLLSAQSDEKLQTEMQKAILEGGQWLYEQRRDGAWGIHERDMKRIFVTCNVLNALIPLMGGEIFKGDSLKFLQEAQNSDGSWGKTQSNNGTGDIYHTAKVLNLLNTYFRSDVRDNIQEGIAYLKREISREHLISSPWLEEEIHDCNDNAKSYYHDEYSELLLLMQRTPWQWNRYEFFKVLETFILLKRSLQENQKFYETNTDQRLKKQIWLLVPAARQSCEIVNRLFPGTNNYICLSDDNKLLGFDLEDEEKLNLMDDEERQRAEREKEKKENRNLFMLAVVMLLIGVVMYILGIISEGWNSVRFEILNTLAPFFIGSGGTLLLGVMSKKFKWMERFIKK